jgi:hypothetical protein
MIGSSMIGRAAADGLLEGHRAGDLERHFARVHVVVAAEDQLDLHVHHRIAGETPFSSASRMPASTGLMNSRGITPPTILSSKTNPAPVVAARG